MQNWRNTELRGSRATKFPAKANHFLYARAEIEDSYLCAAAPDQHLQQRTHECDFTWYRTSRTLGMMSVAEQALLAVSGFVVVAGLLGMLSSLLTSLQERRREMAILRAMGARPKHIFFLLISEASALTLAGIVFGIALLYILIAIISPIAAQLYGINIELTVLSAHEWMLLGLVQSAGILIGFIPAFRAYRQSLADGMTIRI